MIWKLDRVLSLSIACARFPRTHRSPTHVDFRVVGSAHAVLTSIPPMGIISKHKNGTLWGGSRDGNHCSRRSAGSL